MLHRKKRINDNFSVSKLEISMLQTRNTENRLKSTKTWNCKHCWMKMIHKQLAEQLSVSQQAVSNRLRGMGKIQKVDRWVPHMGELNERQIERRKNTCEILLERYRRKSFLHRIITGNEKWIFFWESQAQKIMGRPRRIIHIDRKTESLWQEDALCLVGPEGCSLLWAIEAWWNG